MFVKFLLVVGVYILYFVTHFIVSKFSLTLFLFFISKNITGIFHFPFCCKFKNQAFFTHKSFDC